MVYNNSKVMYKTAGFVHSVTKTRKKNAPSISSLIIAKGEKSHALFDNYSSLFPASTMWLPVP